MKIFVTGTKGQVARALAAARTPHDVVLAGRPEMDLLNAASVRAAIEDARPDVVVNAAAYTSVDKAETESDLAMATNGEGAGHVAAAAAAQGVAVVQISTDYVFDGTLDRPYREDDPTNPVSAYGRSKLIGEEAVRAANPHHAILRTAWVWDREGANFVNTMLRLARDRDVVRVVADQHGTPTYAPDIADAVLAVCGRLAAEPALSGTYHMVSRGETTWAGFARAIFEAVREAGGPNATVEPIVTTDYPTPAPRPANSRLDTAKLTATFDHALPHWQEPLGDLLHRIA